MKLTPLLISMLIYLTSGVMYLFSTHDVHAQVPQTKRSDQDSFLKNIRSKKRNNDLQKARQQKRSSDSSDDWKIRIRFENGNFDKEEGENRSEYKKDVADVKIWSLIFGRIGISNVRKNFYSIKDVPENTDLIAFKRINSESTIISYTFGERFTLTLGTTIENKGDICIGEISKSSDELFNEYCYEKLERKYHEILYYIDKITVGFEIYGIELLIGSGNQDYDFQELQCTSNSCTKFDDEVFNSGRFEDRWFGFGLGIVF